MKYVIILLITAMLVCTGCAPQPNASSPAATNSPAPLKIVSGEYRAVWNESYQYGKPLLIDTFSDWEVFLMDHPGQSQTEDPLMQDYDESFFRNSLIYAYIESEPSGSITLLTGNAVRDGSILKLYMQRIVPQVGTDDMAARVCLFGITRDDAARVKKVEAVISEIHQ